MNVVGIVELQTLEKAQAAYIWHTLERLEWNREKASKVLDINRKTLYRKIKANDLKPGVSCEKPST